MKNFIKKIIGVDREYESHIENIFYLIKKRLKKYNPQNFLDVGCGNGERTSRIAEHFGISANNIYGVDYSDKSIIEATKKFNTQKVNLESEILPYRDEMLDLVISNQVLEHLINLNEI